MGSWLSGESCCGGREVGMANDFFYDESLGLWRMRGEQDGDVHRRQQEAEDSIARLPGHQRRVPGIPVPPPPTGGNVTMARTQGKPTSPWVYTDWTTGETVTIGSGVVPPTLTDINATRRNYGAASSAPGANPAPQGGYPGVAQGGYAGAVPYGANSGAASLGGYPAVAQGGYQAVAQGGYPAVAQGGYPGAVPHGAYSGAVPHGAYSGAESSGGYPGAPQSGYHGTVAQGGYTGVTPLNGFSAATAGRCSGAALQGAQASSKTAPLQSPFSAPPSVLTDPFQARYPAPTQPHAYESVFA